MKASARRWLHSASVALALLFVALVGQGSRGSAVASDAASPLVGSWRLVSYRDTPEHGPAVEAFGAQPIGVFTFTADGHVSVSLMRNPPGAKLPNPDLDPDSCNPDWYCSYFGTYTVDMNSGTYVVHVQGTNVANMRGTDQLRHFVLSGDRMVITEIYTQDAQQVRGERVLVRDRIVR